MTSSTFAPTPEQQLICEAIPDRRSQMIEAMAGTAKTTTLRLAAQKVRKPALALAFNTKIAKELAETFPKNFTCKTLNGLGFLALRRGLPSISKWEVDGQKLGKVIKEVCKSEGVQLAGEQWDQLRRLVSGAQAIGLAPAHEGSIAPDTPETWAEIADRLWIPKEDQEQLRWLATLVLQESLLAVGRGHISFDDQIYAPLVLGCPFLQFPIVFGDEVQDWNSLNHEIVRRSCASGAKLVLAGDSRQSIYAFRGALSDSMSKARGLAPEWLDQKLTLTFRCPKVIVERQQAHAPGYTAAPANLKGQVIQLGMLLDNVEAPETWNIDSLLALGPAPPAILCRNNAPLLSLAFKLIRQRVSVAMLGRDIGKGLVALSKKLAKRDSMPAQEVRAKIISWRAGEVETLRLNEAEESKIDSVEDKAECLLAVLDSAEVPDAGSLRKALEDLFASQTGRVQLSTIHRAKGLEWPVVMHLDPWRVPSKQARTRGGALLQQEMNLRYVAETRARETLVLASLEDFE